MNPKMMKITKIVSGSMRLEWNEKLNCLRIYCNRKEFNRFIKRHRNYNLSNLTEVDTEEVSKTDLKKVGENVCED